MTAKTCSLYSHTLFDTLMQLLSVCIVAALGGHLSMNEVRCSGLGSCDVSIVSYHSHCFGHKIHLFFFYMETTCTCKDTPSLDVPNIANFAWSKWLVVCSYYVHITDSLVGQDLTIDRATCKLLQSLNCNHCLWLSIIFKKVRLCAIHSTNTSYDVQ